MKIRIIFAFALLFGFALLFSAQLQRPLFAEECPLSCPISGPVTGPITGPSLSPTETPVPTDTTTPTPTTSVSPTLTETPTPTVLPSVSPTPVAGSYTLSGRVTYRFMGFFHRGWNRLKPAADVLVTVVNIFTGKKFETQTMADGTYVVSPNEPGLYAVHVSGGETAFYVPPVKIISNMKPAGKKHVNYQGYVFSF